MNVTLKAFGLRVSKKGNPAMFWYAQRNDQPAFMACLANAKLFPLRYDAEQVAEPLREQGFNVEILTVSALGVVP